MAKQRFYLLPGFFGFANLGEFVYFGHVRNMLVDELHRRRIDAEVGRILAEQHERAARILQARTEVLREAAATLLARETITGDELRAFAGRPKEAA